MNSLNSNVLMPNGVQKNHENTTNKLINDDLSNELMMTHPRIATTQMQSAQETLLNDMTVSESHMNGALEPTNSVNNPISHNPGIHEHSHMNNRMPTPENPNTNNPSLFWQSNLMIPSAIAPFPMSFGGRNGMDFGRSFGLPTNIFGTGVENNIDNKANVLMNSENNNDIHNNNENTNNHNSNSNNPNQNNNNNNNPNSQKMSWGFAVLPPSMFSGMTGLGTHMFGPIDLSQEQKLFNVDGTFNNGSLPPTIPGMSSPAFGAQFGNDSGYPLAMSGGHAPTIGGSIGTGTVVDGVGINEDMDMDMEVDMDVDSDVDIEINSKRLGTRSSPPKKKYRRIRKHSESGRGNGGGNTNIPTNNGVPPENGVDASCVKGSSETGYRMILEEPAHKDMLSCHQCKNKKKLKDVIICGHVYMVKHTMKTCTKKYCKSCLLRFYLESPANNNDDPAWPLWKCPCCRFICCCAWCRKKKAKRSEEHASLSIRANAHRLTPATSLARKLVTETGLDGSETHIRDQEHPNSHDNNNNNTEHLLPPPMPEDFLRQQIGVKSEQTTML